MADQQPPPPKNYNVSIQGIVESNRGVNFNIQVTASDVMSALEVAKSELGKVIDGAGLALKPSTPTA